MYPTGNNAKSFGALAKLFFRPSKGNPKLAQAIELVDAGWSSSDALKAAGVEIEFEGGASLENVLGKEGSSNGSRRGKRSTKAGKDMAIRNNQQVFGETTCTNCGTQTTETTQRGKGSTVSPTETQVDHTEARASDGNGPSATDQTNANVKCMKCNNIKLDN